ncbi:penicillin-insensitive murein endopeptidase [Rhizobium sp. SSA_523]|uniref:penicillin-insensitive murein endopeptidase n=1 Tax=Rhizobium sp. SSA_523 TaxID=2952477 RepID=UPI002090B8E7|nr:penicillin-insensitive murein endopeptidase [Rhizobium sp. SSA_523]MCO5732833.1 penicillin-insensitive murein endopeptidase [Rhizobium sp. SSA_523]WKC25787.1 penicillin-insensitive murein endopeptidase [Rhizobium sp. SSA_523]
MAAALVLSTPLSLHADQEAKKAFGSMTLPSAGTPTPIGSYAKGCVSGAVALPDDGPNWQAMRLSRNRHWGMPQTVALLERLSRDATRLGWGQGILVGDMSQPRGGPMAFGHASHQIGLDVDVWFTPMPERRMSPEEREKLPFTSMLDKSKFLTVDSRKFTPTAARLVMTAASYPQVERIFVNPAIKKRLCETWTGDRETLGKVRPMYGHDEHFHIRLGCPAGLASCKPQAPVAAGDGCDKSLAWWFTDEPWAKPKKDPNAPPPKPPRPMMVSDLPKACAGLISAPASAAAYSAIQPVAAPVIAEPQPAADAFPLLPDTAPFPVARPDAE